jgi:hypothetical protein
MFMQTACESESIAAQALAYRAALGTFVGAFA